EPDYVLPYCYYMQPPALKTSHLAKFKPETRFYIFYNMPKDTLQVYAAKELYVVDLFARFLSSHLHSCLLCPFRSVLFFCFSFECRFVGLSRWVFVIGFSVDVGVCFFVASFSAAVH